MYTKNYYMFKYNMKYLYPGYDVSLGWEYYPTLERVKNIDGAAHTIVIGWSYGNGSSSSSTTKRYMQNRLPYSSYSNSKLEIYAGTGSTAESINDYELAEKDTSISCSLNSYICNLVSDYKFKRTLVINCSNTSDTDKTIREIGLYKKYDGRDDYYTFMFLRQVISATTIPSGGSKAITIEIVETITPTDYYTKNYYLFTYYMDYVYGANNGTSDDVYTFTGMKKTDGNNVECRLGDNDNYYSKDLSRNFANRFLYSLDANSSSGKDTSYYAKVGSSNRIENRDDYNLVEELSNVSCSISSNSVNDISTSNFKFTRTIVLNLTNNGDSQVSVKEVGLFKHFGDYAQNTDRGNMLFMRKVLSSPLTIEAGKSELLILYLEENITV